MASDTKTSKYFREQAGRPKKKLSRFARARQQLERYARAGSPESKMGYGDYFDIATMVKKHNREMAIKKDTGCTDDLCEVLQNLSWDWRNAPNFDHLGFLDLAGCRNWYIQETNGQWQYDKWDKLRPGEATEGDTEVRRKWR